MNNQNKIVATTFTVTAFTVIGWFLLSLTVVPGVIADAYGGASLPVLNNMISGQDQYPVQKYLDDWLTFAKRFGFALGILMPLVVVGCYCATEGLKRSDEFGMQRHSMLIAGSVIAMVSVGSVVATIKGSEPWPFSSYPMYSHANRLHELTVMQAYLVDANGNESLVLNAFEPFDPQRLKANLHWHEANGTIDEVCRELLNRYLAQNPEAIKSTIALRVYRCHWQLDDWAANVDHPDLELLHECSWEKSL